VSPRPQCTGCLRDDPSLAAVCDNVCLTACERVALAAIENSHADAILMAEPWTCRAAATGHLPSDFASDPFSVYAMALLVAMLQLVGGVGTTQPSNQNEYLLFFMAILMGTVLLAAVQGVICGVVTNGDPDEISWRQNLDALNFMMSDTGLSHDARLGVRRYFRKSKRLFKRRSYHSLISECLSNSLQRDVRYHIASDIFAGVWWLSACERLFLEELAVRVTRIAYCPHEPIVAPDTLNVIMSGATAHACRALSPASVHSSH
jgi:hypothetical protein